MPKHSHSLVTEALMDGDLTRQTAFSLTEYLLSFLICHLLGQHTYSNNPNLIYLVSQQILDCFSVQYQLISNTY